MTFEQLMQYGLIAFKKGTIVQENELSLGTGWLALCIIICAVIGYFIGSLNFGVIISRLYGADIRTKGSGNAGATNMMRVYGKKASILTFIGDISKTIVAVFLGRLLIFGYVGAYVTGLFVIIGHAFPIYYKFKGGKGVAAISAFCLVTEPIIFLIELAIFLIVLFGFKMVSLASIMIALIYPYMLSMIVGPGPHIIVGFIASALVIFLHRKNIVRIFNHTEHKFNLGKKKKEQTTVANVTCVENSTPECEENNTIIDEAPLENIKENENEENKE